MAVFCTITNCRLPGVRDDWASSLLHMKLEADHTPGSVDLPLHDEQRAATAVPYTIAHALI
jgi:hypothetical protein